MKKWLIVLFLVACSAYAEQDRITKVITLNYLNGEKAVQLLKPLLNKGETISQSDNQLVVDVSKDTLTKIRTVLSRTDVLPVVFEIAVHQDDADWLNRERVQSVTYSTYSHSTAGDDQAVQVSNGESAFISLGSNTPVVSSVGVGWWQTGVAYERMQTEQGFLIEPTAQGSRVKIKVRRFYSDVNPVNQQAAEQQSLDTTTVIPKDRWVKLGSAGHADMASDRPSNSYTAGNSFKDKTSVYIKISTVKIKPDNTENTNK